MHTQIFKPAGLVGRSLILVALLVLQTALYLPAVKTEAVNNLNVSPNSGPVAGGTAITITGSGFATQTTTSTDNRSMATNLDGVCDYCYGFPFLNLVKSSRSWISQKQGLGWDQGGPLDLDENDWVKSLQPGQSADMIFMTFDNAGNFADNQNFYPNATYRVRWKGKGQVRYSLAAQKIADGSQPNEDIIRLNPNGGYAILKVAETDPTDYIRDIEIVPQNQTAVYDAGEIFNPEWLSKLSPYRALRFMDWMGTNNSTTSTWENRRKPTDRSYSGSVPIEIIVALTNKLKVDGWINIPHLANDDYITKTAQYIKNNADPESVFYVEHSNEVWNWQFAQAQYANTQGRQRWAVNGDPAQAPGDSYIQWHGMKTAQICDIFKQQVFTGQASRIKCVLGVQTGYKGLEQGALNCPKWVEEGHEACYKHGIDQIAVTTYFNGGLNGGNSNESNVRSWFSDADGGVAKAISQIKNETYFDAGNALPDLIGDFQYFKNVANNYGLTMSAYEGGSHITANGGSAQDDQAFINFHIAVNRSSEMYDVYQQLLQTWKDNGGDLMFHFTDLSYPSKWGSWGALEYVRQSPTPKYRALSEFSSNTACWWTNCVRTLTTTTATNSPIVMLGDIACQSVNVINDTQLTCISPAGAAGSVNIEVKTSQGASMATLANGFTYIAPTPTTCTNGANNPPDCNQCPADQSIQDGACKNVVNTNTGNTNTGNTDQNSTDLVSAFQNSTIIQTTIEPNLVNLSQKIKVKSKINTASGINAANLECKYVLTDPSGKKVEKTMPVDTDFTCIIEVDPSKTAFSPLMLQASAATVNSVGMTGFNSVAGKGNGYVNVSYSTAVKTQNFSWQVNSVNLTDNLVRTGGIIASGFILIPATIIAFLIWQVNRTPKKATAKALKIRNLN
ncbi:MAG: hypothetical protein OHK0017_06030 [Patescibacteria group bacterium]